MVNVTYPRDDVEALESASAYLSAMYMALDAGCFGDPEEAIKHLGDTVLLERYEALYKDTNAIIDRLKMMAQNLSDAAVDARWEATQ